MDEHPTTKLAREYADCGAIGALGPMRILAEFADRLLALEAMVDAARANDAAYTAWSRTNFSDVELRAAHARTQIKLYSTLAALDKIKEDRR